MYLEYAALFAVIAYLIKDKLGMLGINAGIVAIVIAFLLLTNSIAAAGVLIALIIGVIILQMALSAKMVGTELLQWIVVGVLVLMILS